MQRFVNIYADLWHLISEGQTRMMNLQQPRFEWPELCESRWNGSGVITKSIVHSNSQYVGLSEFCKNDPPFFCNSVNPMKAEVWLQKLEKILRIMRCNDAEKVDFVTYMLGVWCKALVEVWNKFETKPIITN